MILAVGCGIHLEDAVDGDAEGAVTGRDGRRAVLHGNGRGRRGWRRGNGNGCRCRRRDRRADLGLQGIELGLLRVDLRLHGVDLGFNVRWYLSQGRPAQA